MGEAGAGAVTGVGVAMSCALTAGSAGGGGGGRGSMVIGMEFVEVAGDEAGVGVGAATGGRHFEHFHCFFALKRFADGARDNPWHVP